MTASTTAETTKQLRLADGEKVFAALAHLGATDVEHSWDGIRLRIHFKTPTKRLDLVRHMVLAALKDTSFKHNFTEDGDGDTFPPPYKTTLLWWIKR